MSKKQKKHGFDWDEYKTVAKYSGKRVLTSLVPGLTTYEASKRGDKFDHPEIAVIFGEAGLAGVRAGKQNRNLLPETMAGVGTVSGTLGAIGGGIAGASLSKYFKKGPLHSGIKGALIGGALGFGSGALSAIPSYYIGRAVTKNKKLKKLKNSKDENVKKALTALGAAGLSSHLLHTLLSNESVSASHLPASAFLFGTIRGAQGKDTNNLERGLMIAAQTPGAVHELRQRLEELEALRRAKGSRREYALLALKTLPTIAGRLGSYDLGHWVGSQF